MESINFTVKGAEPLLLNNPQTVDPFNPYARSKKEITKKRAKTDEDLLELRRLEVESKVYFDDEMGIYVPATWISAAIAGRSFKQCKISKAEIRSAVFPVESKIKLKYSGSEKVRAISDISGNPDFVKTMLLKQGQVRIAKCAPIFHNWSFDASLEFDPSVIDEATLVAILSAAASYGGFGDFRPTFGRGVFTQH